MVCKAKPFLIPHPSEPGSLLAHACIEGPEIAVYYRGEASLSRAEATVKLPHYFEALTRGEGRTVTLTCKDGWSPLYVDGRVEGGQFRVRTTAAGNPAQAFFWEVKAVRADQVPLVVEAKADLHPWAPRRVKGATSADAGGADVLPGQSGDYPATRVHSLGAIPSGH